MKPAPAANPREMQQLGRAVIHLLRHSAKRVGLPISVDGWVPVAAVLSHLNYGWQGRPYDEVEVRELVATNDKQRFSLRVHADELQIRANQGHTMHEISVELTELAGDSLPSQALHGTYYQAWPSICSRGGLSRMKRNHVHLARGLPGESGVISGMRSSCEVQEQPSLAV